MTDDSGSDFECGWAVWHNEIDTAMVFVEADLAKPEPRSDGQPPGRKLKVSIRDRFAFHPGQALFDGKDLELPDAAYGKLVKAGLVEARALPEPAPGPTPEPKVCLGEFLDGYVKSRADIKPQTIMPGMKRDRYPCSQSFAHP
jgi:hypothetical protein